VVNSTGHSHGHGATDEDGPEACFEWALTHPQRPHLRAMRLLPKLAPGHHGTKLDAYGSRPTTQAERSESFETALAD
jgi:hypothetical protein